MSTFVEKLILCGYHNKKIHLCLHIYIHTMQYKGHESLYWNKNVDRFDDIIKLFHFSRILWYVYSDCYKCQPCELILILSYDLQCLK